MSLRRRGRPRRSSATAAARRPVQDAPDSDMWSRSDPRSENVPMPPSRWRLGFAGNAMTGMGGRDLRQKGAEMPKASESGRDRRRARGVAANLHGESVKAARATSLTHQYRRWRRRRFLAVALVAIGSIIIISHIFAHLADVQWTPMQDLLIGYPMGGVFVVIGLLVLGKK